jgi:hypothetical protein
MPEQHHLVPQPFDEPTAARYYGQIMGEFDKALQYHTRGVHLTVGDTACIIAARAAPMRSMYGFVREPGKVIAEVHNALPASKEPVPLSRRAVERFSTNCESFEATRSTARNRHLESGLDLPLVVDGGPYIRLLYHLTHFAVRESHRYATMSDTPGIVRVLVQNEGHQFYHPLLRQVVETAFGYRSR